MNGLPGCGLTMVFTDAPVVGGGEVEFPDMLPDRRDEECGRGSGDFLSE